MRVTAEAVTLRYRVVEVQWIPNERTVYGNTREFKTLQGAMAYQKSLTGKTTLLQTAILQWMSDEDVYAEITRLQAAGHHIE